MIYILSNNYTPAVDYLLKQAKTTSSAVSICIADSATTDKFLLDKSGEDVFCFFIGDTVLIREQIAKLFNMQLIKDNTIFNSFSDFPIQLMFGSAPLYDPKRTSMTPKGFVSYSLIGGAEFGFEGKLGALNTYIFPESLNDTSYFFRKIVKPKLMQGLLISSILEYSLFSLDCELIEKKLQSLITSKNISYSLLNQGGGCFVLNVVCSSAISHSQSEAISSSVYSVFSDELFAEENISLSRQVIELLSLRKKKLAVAESITGGMICSNLVDISGASQVLIDGCIAYTNNSKINRLNVSEETLLRHTAVSKETAHEMILGLLDTTNCDYAVATTGYAGPSLEKLTEPIGLCYIAVGNRDNIRVFEYNFTGDRQKIRSDATNMALFQLLKYSKSN